MSPAPSGVVEARNFESTDLAHAEMGRQARAAGALRAGVLLAMGAEMVSHDLGATMGDAGLAIRGVAAAALLLAFGLVRVGRRPAADAVTLGTVLALPVGTFALDPGSQATVVYAAPLWSLSLMFLVALRYSTRVAAVAGTLALATLLAAPLLGHQLDSKALFSSAVFFAVVLVLILYSYGTRRANIRTITSQARDLADREARLRSILDTAFDGIAILSEGRVTEANQAFCRLLGLEGDAVGRPFRDLVGPGSHRVLDCGSGGTTDRVAEIDLLHSDGSPIPVEVACRPFIQGGHKTCVLTVRDLRERRRIEKLRSELLVTASHELRTPVTAIHGSICTITDLMPSGVPPEVLKLMDAAKKSSNRLVRLVKDLLDAERLECGQMQFQFRDVDLLDVAEDAVDAVHLVAVDCGVAIEILERSDCAQVHGDADRLVQVVVNLLANAIRYSRAGGIVRVEVGVENEVATVAVRDTGAGIPEAFRPCIFERFARRRAEDEAASSGSGLGLYICREIVRAHGGAIDFETAEGTGTTFRFTIPSRRPNGKRAPGSPEPADLDATSGRFG